MSFIKKLVLSFMVLICAVNCCIINAQEFDVQKYVQLKHDKTLLNFCVQRPLLYQRLRDASQISPIGNFLGCQLPDPYRDYLDNLSLNHKIWNAIGTSNFGYQIRRFSKKLDDLRGLPPELYGPVGQDIHTLVQEAQTAVGISKDNHVRVGLLNPQSAYLFLALAATTSKAIIFNEDYFSSNSYGVNRIIAHHESVHAKYDHGQDELISIFVGLGASIILKGIVDAFIPKNKNEELDRYKYVKMFASSILGFFVNYNLCNKLRVLSETRADREGCFASRCGQCVSDLANARGSSEWQCKYFKESGYLTGPELNVIVKKLEKYSCDYHKNKKNTSKLDAN